MGPAKAKGPSVSLSDLVKVKTLGTGTFGRVKLVQHRKTKQVGGSKLGMCVLCMCQKCV